MGGGYAPSPSGKAGVTLPYSQKQLTDVVDGMGEIYARVKNLLALADDLLAAMDAGEPVAGQLVRLQEMNAVAAAMEEQAGVHMPTYFAMKRAFLQAKAQASSMEDAGQPAADAAAPMAALPPVAQASTADVGVAGDSNHGDGASGVGSKTSLLALTDDLLAAIDAGEPVSGQLARLEEMNAVAAAAVERDHWAVTPAVLVRS
uniref:Uncharacterized protein n=1 Tax=Oryza glumipatula TaxID=40148 RepID=A0A0E0A5L4_9ORYZ